MELNDKVLSTLAWWMKERESIRLKKEAGAPWPWSDHPVMQGYRFCNVFREDDKTTAWLRDSGVRRMGWLPTFIFRRFNLIATGKLLLEAGLLDHWDEAEAVQRLGAVDGPVFTGAFMISSPNGEPKMPAICRMITAVVEDAAATGRALDAATTLEEGWRICRWPHHTGLMAYELVTDLQQEGPLQDATDARTWGYFGPGAQRGVCRLLGREVNGAAPSLLGSPDGQRLCCSVGQELLQRLGPLLEELHRGPALLRDVESGCCELGKLLTICEGGRARRRYAR